MPHQSDYPPLESRTEASTMERDIDIEKLGRQRPEIFKNRWAELGFCISVLGSVLMAEFFVSGFHIILPPLISDLNIPQGSQTWPSSVFSLVTGAFLLPMGRLADMYGGYLVFNISLVWFLVWSLIAGFSQDYMMLIFCRALQGLGSAGFLPTSIMLLGKTYRPGPRKNLVFGLYGAFAPLGFFFGILFGGISAELLSWRWYFYLGTIILGAFCVMALLTVPRDCRLHVPDGLTMDWYGLATIVPGLLLLVYAVTDSSQAPQGWASPQIIITLILGVLLLTGAVYVEGWVSPNPLLPADIFRVKNMKILVVALLFAYGVFGLFLFYSSFYIELVLHVSPILTAIWYIPMIVGGLLFGAAGGVILHRLPGRILLGMAGAGNLLCVLLFALMPENPNYWAWVMPAMIAATIGVDITFTVANVFITTNMPSHKQGLAGAVANSCLYLGISFFLGFGEVAVGQTKHLELRKNYQVAFWLAVGVAGVAMSLLLLLRIGEAKSELTDEEKERLGSESQPV